MPVHDIEKTSLDAHVSICQVRYQNLADKLDQFEDRLNDLEHMVRDIHQAIKSRTEERDQKWDRARDAVIVLLVGMVAYLVDAGRFFR